MDAALESLSLGIVLAESAHVPASSSRKGFRIRGSPIGPKNSAFVVLETLITMKCRSTRSGNDRWLKLCPENLKKSGHRRTLDPEVVEEN